MKQQNCIAMILAGGRGERLGSLTTSAAKPAVPFGGKYKIIDFTLNNCKNSEIGAIGVMTQYLPSELHSHIRKNTAADTKCMTSLLPSKTDAEYSGTADAVYKNIQFIEKYNPDYVLILSGDHVYEMDYRDMLEFHMEKNADVTIASKPVPFHEAYRFGILSADENGMISHFEEKPKLPKSNLASMGVYIFKWERLKEYLMSDCCDETSAHDFGKNIIPKMMREQKKMFTYTFNGYWKDIGTVYSLWEANMDIVHKTYQPTPFSEVRKEIIELHRSDNLEIRMSVISDYRKVSGNIAGSVISDNVKIGENSVVNDCVIMPNVTIGRNVTLNSVIVGSNATIMDNAEIGTDNGSEMFTENHICSMGISLVAPQICIEEGLKFTNNSHIDKSPTSSIIEYTPRNYALNQVFPAYIVNG